MINIKLTTIGRLSAQTALDLSKRLTFSLIRKIIFVKSWEGKLQVYHKVVIEYKYGVPLLSNNIKYVIKQ